MKSYCSLLTSSSRRKDDEYRYLQISMGIIKTETRTLIDAAHHTRTTR